MKKKEIRFRCWIELDGEKFFGPGPAELLQRIHDTGSISRAARDMGMSYKKAWDLVEMINSRAKKPLVARHKGGLRGGGAELTPTGKKVIAAYASLTRKISALVVKQKKILTLV